VSRGLQALTRLPAGRWRVLVPVVCLLAGFGFAVTAHESRGSALRAPSNANLADLVRNAEADVKSAEKTYADLQAQLAAATQAAGRDDAAVANAQRDAGALAAPGGLTAVSGPGITVILDDAGDPSADPGVDPNQLVVHQSDLQAVVNALWAGGAEDMTISGQRVIATSAVRCVGNTLLINGEVFSPPFQVAAIGPFHSMVASLDASRGVTYFKEAAAFYGLGYTVESEDHLQLPAYKGPIGLTYARPG
jgi:uncharacterized protein YlxW (UPF0749 family)